MNRQEFDAQFDFIHKTATIAQRKEELWIIFQAVRDYQPKLALEIGTESGGTSWFWSRAVAPGGKLYAMDLVERPLVDLSGAQCEFQYLVRDSHSLDTIKEFEKLLDGEKLDFLYIDGDHSYEGVKMDYELFTPFVREGGIVGFHDTNHPPVRQLLLEKNHPRLYFIDYGLGTGVIRGW